MLKRFHIIILLLLFFIYFLANNKTKIYDNFTNYNLNNELIIINNFFSKNDFKKIKKLCLNKKFKNDNRLYSRKTICLFKKKNIKLYDLIYKNNKLKKFIKKNYDKKFTNSPSFPIEYRIYPKDSTGMKFHKDLSMFSPDCLEVILTLENNSDSKFQWFENNFLKEIYPKENTLCIVKPNTIIHGVSPTYGGTRKILKFIIEFENSKKKRSFYEEIKNCPN